ncbi:MAG: SIS domain-containing protein [Verrucomicrobiaceae bacterium]|nr:SIS domain-containing protein [Verrucomicrobiaceae bacterium]|tara:strand:- start:713 stop:1498 length:786 start_codon:yes stop_codon:yes gene_type:complete
MSLTRSYIGECENILKSINDQQEVILEVAHRFAETILKGRVVHLFGSGHSRIMVEEMWPRYGSYPGFNPIVELSLTFHNQVSGSNGQRQAMFLENVSGFASRVLRNFDISDEDSALVVSSGGCNIVPVEIAEEFQKLGVWVAGIVSLKHCEGSKSKREDGKKLTDFSDLVLDTGAPLGDSMINIEGLETPVSPGSTVGGCVIINSLKAEIAKLLIDAGKTPKVLTSGAIVGDEKATQLFEAAYDEHSRRMATLYSGLGLNE